LTKQQPRGKPFDTERGRLAGQTSRSHGLDAIANRGEAALLDATAAMEFRELRDALRLPDAREEIKLELMARLVIMARVGFDQMGAIAQQGGDPFKVPVVGRLGTYLNLLARLLASFPQQDRADHARLVGEMTERVEKAKVQRGNDQVPSTEAPETPQAHDGSRLEDNLS